MLLILLEYPAHICFGSDSLVDIIKYLKMHVRSSKYKEFCQVFDKLQVSCYITVSAVDMTGPGTVSDLFQSRCCCDVIIQRDAYSRKHSVHCNALSLSGKTGVSTSKGKEQSCYFYTVQKIYSEMLFSVSYSLPIYCYEV